MDRGIHRGRRTARGLAGAITVVVLAMSALAACSGDHSGPAPTPSSSSSVQPAETATPTPDVTVTKPALLLGQPTAASAIAFVKYFIDTYNYAYATYDTTLLDDISKPSCTSCAGIITEVGRLKRENVKVVGSESFFVDAFLPTKELKDNHLYVLVVMSQRPGSTVSRDGKVTKVDGTKLLKSGFGLDWDGGKWLVSGVSKEGAGTPWLG